MIDNFCGVGYSNQNYMRLYRSSRFFQFLFQKSIWRINTSQKEVYLTFDDGPTPEVTPFVLEQLRLFNAKATFFCVGQNVEKHPEIYKSVLNDGHSVGNHTYSHNSVWKTNLKTWLKDVDTASALINSSLFRPPYGHLTWMSERKLRSKGLTPIMWNFITYDFDKTSDPILAIDLYFKTKKEGSIVVMHDQPKALPNIKVILPELLKRLSKEGFAFKAIPNKKSIDHSK
ncbi:MAG: polysaccharide deacetylase family protein [Bacteroidetes bacterium]|nr:polysaccharide deacetylase family protein [Bacteroidota bacterium]